MTKKSHPIVQLQLIILISHSTFVRFLLSSEQPSLSNHESANRQSVAAWLGARIAHRAPSVLHRAFVGYSIERALRIGRNFNEHFRRWSIWDILAAAVAAFHSLPNGNRRGAITHKIPLGGWWTFDFGTRYASLQTNCSPPRSSSNL